MSLVPWYWISMKQLWNFREKVNPNMINGRLCETKALFLASPRHFDCLHCDTENSKCFEWECDTFRAPDWVESSNELVQPSGLTGTGNFNSTVRYGILQQNNCGLCPWFCSFSWNSDNLEEVGINFFLEICKSCFTEIQYQVTRRCNL